MDTKVKTVLSVGGGSKNVKLPHVYEGWEVKILDINPAVKPDVCMDARELKNWKGEKFDSVYCSHNLEHFRHHEVLDVLDGMFHVLKDDGYALIIVPDIYNAMKKVIEADGDLDTVMYEVRRGIVTLRDMLWGHAGSVRAGGNDWMIHKTGFSERILAHAVYDAGFKHIVSESTNNEIILAAWKEEPVMEMKLELPS